MSYGGLHLFLGPDRPRKLERIRELTRTSAIQPLDRHTLDAAQLRPAELLAVCRQQPAASPLRLVVIDQAHRLGGDSVNALLEHAPTISQTAAVILLVEMELSARHPLAHAADAMAAERFAERGAAPAGRPFALTDALGAGDPAGALAALREQLLSGREPTEMLALVAWQVQRWVAVKRWLSTGASADRIASASGLKPWQVERIRSEVSRRSLASLQETLSRCWQLDAEMKSGRAIPDVAIEQCVVEVCAGGESR